MHLCQRACRWITENGRYQQSCLHSPLLRLLLSLLSPSLALSLPRLSIPSSSPPKLLLSHIPRDHNCRISGQRRAAYRGRGRRSTRCNTDNRNRINQKSMPREATCMQPNCHVHRRHGLVKSKSCKGVVNKTSTAVNKTSTASSRCCSLLRQRLMTWSRVLRGKRLAHLTRWHRVLAAKNGMPRPVKVFVASTPSSWQQLPMPPPYQQCLRH